MSTLKSPNQDGPDDIAAVLQPDRSSSTTITPSNFPRLLKELSKIVAFVKGTQFDLLEFLQRERYGSAHLDNFASGLELIGQKILTGLEFKLEAENGWKLKNQNLATL
ncbi:hypothetical protein AgCh_037376 [Apium graveolens]